MPSTFICTGVTVVFVDCHAETLRLCSYSRFLFLVHLYACFCMCPHLGSLSRPLRRRDRVTLVLSGLLRLSTLASLSYCRPFWSDCLFFGVRRLSLFRLGHVNKMRLPTSVVIRAKNRITAGSYEANIEFSWIWKWYLPYRTSSDRRRSHPSSLACRTVTPWRPWRCRTKVSLRSGAGRSLADGGHVTQKRLGDTAEERDSSRNRHAWRSG